MADATIFINFNFELYVYTNIFSWMRNLARICCRMIKCIEQLRDIRRHIYKFGSLAVAAFNFNSDIFSERPVPGGERESYDEEEPL